MAQATVVIGGRYNGPAGSGNGGYSAGRFALAADLAGDVEVTLRRPPPLDRPLEVRPAGAVVGIWAGDDLIADVRPADSRPADAPLADAGDPSVPAVAPVSWDTAVAASARFPGLTAHPFPTCFVCGTARAEGDGLRLFPGLLADGRTATPWHVPAAVTEELVWAALDCPGIWTVTLAERPYVLGRLAVHADALPRPGQRCVVMGAVTGLDGRKAFTATALYGPDGTPLATARATWISVSA